jgi:glycerophosphoryl diester phosphodiesterase
MDNVPRQIPGRAALENCKIISHRGEHDNRTVFENTLPAFEIARRNGVWGIECDIRWTADHEPVICHDPTVERVFGASPAIGKVSLRELRERIPLVPTLEELLARFAGNTHLMLELKAEPFPEPELQKRRLQELLAPWEPGRDYHLLALDPTLFQLFDIVPAQYCCPVAEENVEELLEVTLDSGYGGLGGHFLLLNDRVKSKLESAGQRLGTGFIASRNCLFREVNRGVEWIFSNHAVKIQKIRDHYLAGE